ncbi:hypothetical protein HMPREF1869_00464 [Bacteroidales bacterium KA00251]|nr:hypothetical protein HMPREF1869_00464 [Bacteroidales bacterium KA00251]
MEKLRKNSNKTFPDKTLYIYCKQSAEQTISLIRKMMKRSLSWKREDFLINMNTKNRR